MSVPLDDLPANVSSDFLRHTVAHGLLTDAAAIDAYEEACRKQVPINEVLLERGILTEHTAESLLRLLYKPQAVKVLAGYQILVKLGEGATASVYKALQLSIDREVALKVMSPQFTRHKLGRERFLREARLAAQVGHPNVVGVHDVGEDNGRLYIAMEYVSGGDAHRVAAQYGGQLPDRLALRIFRDCAEGLVAINRADMIHRDIKPSNIFITEKGVAKLADLGLACNELGEDRLTVTGGIIGTPAFMSPEQARGDQTLDVRSDIYSLGASMFDLAVGHPPFQGQNAFMVVNKVINEPAPDPYAQKPEISRGLARTIRKCMCYEVDQRYQHPQDLLAAIENVLASHTSINRVRGIGGSSARRRAVGGSSSSARPPAVRHEAHLQRRESRSRPRRWRGALALLLLVVALLTGAGSWYCYLREDARGLVELSHLWRRVTGTGEPDAREAGGRAADGEAVARPEREPDPGSEPDPELPPAAPPPWTEGEDAIGPFGRLYHEGNTVVFRRIPAGTFTMGSRPVERGHEDDERLHRVTLTEAFWLADAECTQRLWETVMGGNPSAFPHPKRPVERVSWLRAQDFLRRFEADMPGLRLRLPTEAEWEYACRAGHRTVYSGEGEYDDQAWHRRTTRRAIGGQKPQYGRRLEPNPWGLYDMLGNVAEWTADAYGEYQIGKVTDPARPAGEFRAYRGGSWQDSPDRCRPASREHGAPDGVSRRIGFRLVLVSPPTPPTRDARGAADAESDPGGVREDAGASSPSPGVAPSLQPAAD